MKAKTLKVIFIVLGSLLLAISLFFNIVLGVSSNLSEDDDDFSIRHKIYNYSTNSFYLLDEGKGMMIKTSRKTNSQEEGDYLEEFIYCKRDNTTWVNNCSMKGYLYDEDKSLMRTTYVPGDGYKYVETSTSKTKELYHNNNLLNYGYYAFVNFFYSYGAVLDSTNNNLEFDIDNDFSFKNFSFNKVITIEYDEVPSGVQVTDYKIFIDSNNMIEKIILNKDIIMEVTLDCKEIDFPDFSNFQ